MSHTVLNAHVVNLCSGHLGSPTSPQVGQLMQIHPFSEHQDYLAAVPDKSEPCFCFQKIRCVSFMPPGPDKVQLRVQVGAPDL